jgi:hypothetical protein
MKVTAAYKNEQGGEKMKIFRVTKYNAQDPLLTWDFSIEKEARAFAAWKNASAEGAQHSEVSEVEEEE